MRAPDGEAPIARTADRLAALDDFAGFDVGVGSASGWLPLASVVTSGVLDSWFATLLERHGHAGATGSLIGGALARAVVAPTVSAMVLDARCPSPDAENLAIRLGDDGSVERYGLREPTATVLPADPAAEHPDSVVVPDEAALVDWWAVRAAETLTPLLAAVRARSPFGLRALWGGLADEVTGVALWIGQLAHRDPTSVWSLGSQLVDSLAMYAPVSLPRARPFPVSGYQHWFQVRATCCLYYRSATESAPVKDRYCSTCPLRDDGSRNRILADYLATLSTVD